MMKPLLRILTISSFAAMGATAHAQYFDVQEGGTTVASFPSDLIQGIRFNTPEEDAETRAKYSVARIDIVTAGNADIVSKEYYIDCSVEVTSDYEEWNYSGEAQIRGRGNSSWLWYDKKPYRIKLKKKVSLLGMPQGKSWVLLANYRDPTHLMHSYVFVLGQMLGLQYTNDVRYAEVTLNGKSIGLYQLTEQVQQGDGRVNIDEDGGYLISLDADDGPYYSPDATDNFWSTVYDMPVCVKNPDDPDEATVKQVKRDLKYLEEAIYYKKYDEIKTLLDVQSMIDFLIIQELVYNVELDAPRSMYMYRDIDGDIWHMGPLWDFDAGYDFDWSTMYTGHTYFTDYTELVLGTSPAQHKGTIYSVPGFFSDLFYIPDFVTDYKARWQQIKTLPMAAWYEVQQYTDYDSMQRNATIWPIDKNYADEITRMGKWLRNRVNYLDKVIASY